MMLDKKGQFYIIAALFIAIILVATVIVTYSSIRTDQFANQPKVLSSIDVTNLAIKQVLGFALGYYGSILQVTGNQSYANSMALQYLQSGFVNIQNMNPEWGASFNIAKASFHLNWYSSNSYSQGTVTVKYSLNGLGINNVLYSPSCELGTTISNSSDNQARINVVQDLNQSLINLGQTNFKFYQYSFTNSSWKKVSPIDEPYSFANGTYLIKIPSNVNPYSYLVQIQDSRGIIVVASSFDHYCVSLNWNSTIYGSTSRGSILSAELFQNGTTRWLGQDLQTTEQIKPLPPVPTKSIRVNETTNGVNRQVPFQIEDWASNFMIPLGLTNNASVFGNRNLLVFLINPNVTCVTIWWDGSDTAKQTTYASVDRYFIGDQQANHVLDNTKLTLSFNFGSGTVTAQVIGGSVESTTQIMRINNYWSIYGSQEAYTISNGIVRDVVLVESEWSNGVPNCPNFYSLTVFTLPACVTYYTYQARITFLNSTQPRTISDLTLLSTTCTNTGSVPQTENGTQGGYPLISNAASLFYNSSAAYWAHHWSQINSTTNGAGVVFTTNSNNELYVFDNATNKVGGLRVTANNIQVQPVGQGSVSFKRSMDTIWYGAIDTFDTQTQQIYYATNGTRAGLWVTVEYPPTYSVTTGVNAPRNITVSNTIAELPITITNTQSSATLNPFQLKITWNPSNFTSYETPDLGNIQFYSDSACTQPLYAWLESCTPSLSNNATSATAWVQLTDSIAANGGTLTIYMAFLSKNTEFDANYWGEAPNLSPTYGQYDNGANVFTQYGGSSWGSFTTVEGTWDSNNGYLEQTATTGNCGWGGPAALIEGTSYSVSSSYILETAVSYTSQADARVGIIADASVMSNDPSGYRFIGQQGGNGAGFVSFLNDWVAWVADSTYQGKVGIPYTLQVVDNAGTWSGALYSGYGISGAALTTLAATSYTNANEYGVTNGYVGVSAAYYNGGTVFPNPAQFQWFRMRVYPPGNVMPSISLGILTSPP